MDNYVVEIIGVVLLCFFLCLAWFARKTLQNSERIGVLETQHGDLLDTVHGLDGKVDTLCNQVSKIIEKLETIDTRGTTYLQGHADDVKARLATAEQKIVALEKNVFNFNRE